LVAGAAAASGITCSFRRATAGRGVAPRFAATAAILPTAGRTAAGVEIAGDDDSDRLHPTGHVEHVVESALDDAVVIVGGVSVVTGTSVVAGILDAEKLEALVILLTATSHRCKLITPTAIEGGCRTAFLTATKAAASTASLAAALGGAGRATTPGALTAALGRRCRGGATGATAAAFAAPASPSAAAARFSRLTVFCFCGASCVATSGPGCIGSGTIHRSRGLTHAVTRGQRLVFKISSGTSRGDPRLTVAGTTRRFAAIAVSLRTDAALSLAIAAAAATATSSAPTAAAGSRIAVVLPFAERVPAGFPFVGSVRFPYGAGAIESFARFFGQWPFKTVVRFSAGRHSP